MKNVNADPVARLLHGVLVLGRRMRTERPPGSLSLSALGILGALNRVGPTAATRLAAEERLQPQSLTRLISELEQSRLIARQRSNDDRREITIAITARGRRVLLDDLAARRDWLETALDEALDPAERGVILAASAVMVKLASHKSVSQGSKIMTTELRNRRETLSVDNSDLSESSFSNTRLERSSYDDVNMRAVAFSDVNLSYASFVNVNLTGVSIENAKLDGMKIDGVLVSALMDSYRRTRGAFTQKPRPSAILFAKDLEGMARFYETVASMSIVHADQAHTVLESELFQLTLHAVPKIIADAIEMKRPPDIRTNVPIKLCFQVASIPDARRSALELGGMLNPSAQEWTEREFRICDGYDPEGNVIQVRSNLA